MPLHYVDTSALAKRYLLEPGTPWVNALLVSEPFAISHLAIVELGSVLARRTQEGAISPDTRDATFRTFLSDKERLVVIELSLEVVLEAATILLDALHVASARLAFARARRQEMVTGAFVTADQQLVNAARWAGLTALIPEDDA
ncbi:MAG: hypothetical protein EXR50_01370 [Dehalococcoidia bacterium]|nr:hypothetical protein [Dehalococcoidia bacterium]